MILASATAPRLQRDNWITLGVLILFYIINAIDRTLLSLMVGPAKHDLAIDDAQIGLLLGLAFATLYAIAGVPLGVLADRMSRRLLLCIGIIAWSLAAVACGFARTYQELLIARMALGIGEAALMPAAHALIADKFPPHRLSMALSIFYVGGVLGNSLSLAAGGTAVGYFGRYPIIGLGALGSVRGWQFPFLLIGGLGLLASVFAFAFKEPPRASRPIVDPHGSLSRVLGARRAAVAGILGSYAVFAMVMYGVILWTPTYMVRAFGWSHAAVGSSFAIINLLGAGLGTASVGWMVDKQLRAGRTDGYFRVFVSCLMIATPAGILAFLVPSPAAFLTLLSVLFFFGFSYSGYAAATVQAIAPIEARGRMAALYLLVLILVGNGIGPWLIGVVTQDFLHDEARLGQAIALMIAVLAPTAMCSALAARGALVRAIALTRMESAGSATPPARESPS